MLLIMLLHPSHLPSDLVLQTRPSSPLHVPPLTLRLHFPTAVTFITSTLFSFHHQSFPHKPYLQDLLEQ